jgi:hypothetical protein
MTIWSGRSFRGKHFFKKVERLIQPFPLLSGLEDFNVRLKTGKPRRFAYIACERRRSRLEKQPTALRRKTCLFWDRH